MFASFKIRSLLIALLVSTLACSSTNQSADLGFRNQTLEPIEDECPHSAPDPLELPKIEGEDFHRECGDPNCLSHQSPAQRTRTTGQAELMPIDRSFEGDWEQVWQPPPGPTLDLESETSTESDAEGQQRSFWQRIDWADVGKFTAVTVLVGAAITVDAMLIVSSEGKSGAPCTELVLTILKG